MNTRQELFLEEHVDCAVIPCSQSRRCTHWPNRLHPLNWHKNSHWDTPMVHHCSVIPHPVSSIMVKAAYLYRIPLRLWYDSIQLTSCTEHLTFLDRFELFSPKTTFWAAVKLYSPQAPVTSISTAEWRTTFFFLSCLQLSSLFYSFLSLSWKTVNNYTVFIFCRLVMILQTAISLSYLFMLLLYKFHILFLVG